MSLRRLNRTPKTRAEKGAPHAIGRRIKIRADVVSGRKYEWHPTKGFRRWA